MKKFYETALSLGFLASLAMIPMSMLLGIWVDIRWWPMALCFGVTTIICGIMVAKL